MALARYDMRRPTARPAMLRFRAHLFCLSVLAPIAGQQDPAAEQAEKLTEFRALQIEP